jgi:hypothetical protein
MHFYSFPMDVQTVQFIVSLSLSLSLSLDNQHILLSPKSHVLALKNRFHARMDTQF